LLLDVDGVLNPFPDTPEGYSAYEFFPDDDYPLRLAAAHGPWLRELANVFEIVWVSAWGEKANDLICPVFDLAPLRVIDFPRIPFHPRDKVPAVASFVGDRPAAWVEDIVTKEAREWATSRSAPTLIVEIDSATGLTRRVVDELLRWGAS
jgi:hypothetical protein